MSRYARRASLSLMVRCAITAMSPITTAPSTRPAAILSTDYSLPNSVMAAHEAGGLGLTTTSHISPVPSSPDSGWSAYSAFRVAAHYNGHMVTITIASSITSPAHGNTYHYYKCCGITMSIMEKVTDKDSCASSTSDSYSGHYNCCGMS